MTNDEFDKLCEEVLRGADPKAFVQYAARLRAMVIGFIDEQDRWDEDWKEIGYKWNQDDEDEADPVWNKLLKWAKKHGVVPFR